MSRDRIYISLSRWKSTQLKLFRYWQEINRDFWNNRQTSWPQKFWAYRRGFSSDKIVMYGLSAQNYRQYMSDFDYYQLRGVNGPFSKWIDDKLTFKYVLQPFKDYLPNYFFMSETGMKIIRLPDCPSDLGTSVEDIIKLLQRKGSLAAKLISGSRGEGFYKMDWLNQQFLINDAQMDIKQMKVFLTNLQGYLFTEYLNGHRDLNAIGSPNSVRITVLNLPNESLFIAGALMRFATSISGAVDNISSGGVFCQVDTSSGWFFDGRQLTGNEWIKYSYHPDSGAALEGNLPYWPQILNTIASVCDYLPQLVWMGFDIMITDYGYKIVEINSNPTIARHNYYHPFYKRDADRRLYMGLIARAKGKFDFEQAGGKS